MLGNTFGRLFRVTTCGESYGKGKGSGLAAIIDGVPPGLKITKEIIQAELDKRKPGVGKLNSPRKELDQCEIFSGIGQDGVTTGTPLGIMVCLLSPSQFVFSHGKALSYLSLQPKSVFVLFRRSHHFSLFSLSDAMFGITSKAE